MGKRAPWKPVTTVADESEGWRYVRRTRLAGDVYFGADDPNGRPAPPAEVSGRERR